jgi:hypothetical protein
VGIKFVVSKFDNSIGEIMNKIYLKLFKFILLINITILIGCSKSKETTVSLGDFPIQVFVEQNMDLPDAFKKGWKDGLKKNCYIVTKDKEVEYKKFLVPSRPQDEKILDSNYYFELGVELSFRLLQIKALNQEIKDNEDVKLKRSQLELTRIDNEIKELIVTQKEMTKICLDYLNNKENKYYPFIMSLNIKPEQFKDINLRVFTKKYKEFQKLNNIE